MFLSLNRPTTVFAFSTFLCQIGMRGRDGSREGQRHKDQMKDASACTREMAALTFLHPG